MRIANSAAGKRVEFAGASGGLESSDEEHGSLDRALSRQHASHEIGRAVKEDEIDKMLDAMGEADSSSEEEIELRLH